MHNTTIDTFKYFFYRKEPICGSRCIMVGHMVVEPKTPYPHPRFLDKHPTEYLSVNTSRSLDGFHLVYIMSGSGWYKNDNGDSFTVRPGSILPLFPKTSHAYSPHEGSGWIEYSLGCDGSYPNWLLKEASFQLGQRPISIGTDSGLLHDFRQLCETANADVDDRVRGHMLGGLINRLLGRIMVMQSSRQNRSTDEYDSIIERVTSYLESHMDSDISQRELSEICGLTYRRLSQLFKEATGVSPHQYFLDRKIKIASNLLKSGVSVTDVSLKLGFDSPYYFSRLFKIKTGQAPSSLIPGK